MDRVFGFARRGLSEKLLEFCFDFVQIKIEVLFKQRCFGGWRFCH